MSISHPHIPNTARTIQQAQQAVSSFELSSSKDMPPPPPPNNARTVSSTSSDGVTRPDINMSQGAPEQGQHSSSRSPSRTPRVRPSPISRTIDETFSQGSVVGLGRPRGHSTSSLRSPPILQPGTSSSSPSVSPLQQAHVTFPAPDIPPPHQTSSPATTEFSSPVPAARGIVTAAPMVRVVSSPLPFPSSGPTAVRPSTATKAEVRSGRGRGRSFSFNRFVRPHTSSGSDDESGTPSLRKRDWLAQISSTFTRRSRSVADSNSDVLSIKSVNVAEVLSHRIVSTRDIDFESTAYRRGEGIELNDPDDEAVFAWTLSEHQAPRTVDAGYGYEVQHAGNGSPDGEESGEQRPRSNGTIFGHHRESESRSRHENLDEDQQLEEGALHQTRDKVVRATSYVVAGAHEVLAAGAEVLEFAPLPGLAEAARVLLQIWDAVQMVDLNKKVCLRLTERCATMLISIRDEIAGADGISSPKPSPTLLGSPTSGSPRLGASSSPGSNGPSGNHRSPKETSSLPGNSPRGRHSSPKHAGNSSPRLDSGSPGRSKGHTEISPSHSEREGQGPVGDELRAPLERLVAAFNQVLAFLRKQNKRPFLKRYLKRDEIQQQLAACDASLNDALGMFSLSIQIRILKQVLRAEEQRQADTTALVERILHTPPQGFMQLPPYHESLSPPFTIPGFRPGLAPSQFDSVQNESGTGLLLESAIQLEDSRRLNPLDFPGLPTLDAADDSSAHVTFPEPVHYPALSVPIASAKDPSTLNSQEIIDTLTHLTQAQNSFDLAHDAEALRKLMRKALEASDDLEMMKVLQVPKEEIPEALKALQRAQETEITKNREAREQPENGEMIIGDEIWASPVEDVGVENTQTVKEGAVGSQPSTRHTTQVREFPTTQTIASSTSTSSNSGSHASRDTLDQEFIEASIESLVRLSTSHGAHPVSLSLPSWTITHFEVFRDAKIGVGYFSEVWRGSYRRRIVAIKVLAPWTPKELFVKEVLVWNELRHPNILELIGASAYDFDSHHNFNAARGGSPSLGLAESMHSTATGLSESGSGWDVPEEARSPWFFVSRFYARGSAVKWVKGLTYSVWETMLDHGEQTLLRMLHEIVRGMVYLHDKGILHGDLKCSNVLINDFGHCIISDFGQSELKSEACRISGIPLPHGTLRWQAPEMMSGNSNLTPEIDVYAFAITCIEILTKGSVPWPLASDDTVRHFVLQEDRRPDIPHLRSWSSPLAEILQQCWSRSPTLRPSFPRLEEELALLRKSLGWNGIEIVQKGETEYEQEWEAWIDGLDRTVVSPALTVVPLPALPPDVTSMDLPSFSTNESDSYVTARGSTHQISANLSHGSATTGEGHLHESVSEPILGSPKSDTRAPTPLIIHSPQLSQYPSRASSIVFAPSTDHSDDVMEDVRSVTPPPANPRIAEIRNERRYRLSLQHEYHPSLILPLWTPSSVMIGAVGYHRKPSGTFVTLFNAFSPSDSSDEATRKLSSLNGYVNGFGTVPVERQKLDKRTPAQKGWDKFLNWLPRGKAESTSPRSVTRRYTAPLRNGHKVAHMFAESTSYRFIDDLSAPKRWFRANIDEILRIYGPDHPVQKEDILLVIGTLDAANYALFVSHYHPDSLVNFNVLAPLRTGLPWGQFVITKDLSASMHGGPVYHEDIQGGAQSASKVSLGKKNSDAWDTVLLARLRFAPDRDEPTSL